MPGVLFEVARRVKTGQPATIAGFKAGRKTAFAVLLCLFPVCHVIQLFKRRQ